MAKDWLGQDYEVGDTVVYAAMSGRCANMQVARVVAFKDNGNVVVQGLSGARWNQHHERVHYVDNRTGKRIRSVYADEHIAVGSHWKHPVTGETYDLGGRSAYYRRPHEPGALELVYVPVQFKDYVEKITEGPKPVTLQKGAGVQSILKIDPALVEDLA